MTNDLNKVMARKIATRINKIINIPFINEEQEQVIFEFVVMILLDLFISGLDSLTEKN